MHEQLTPVWLDERLEGVAVAGSSPIEGGLRSSGCLPFSRVAPLEVLNTKGDQNSSVNP